MPVRAERGTAPSHPRDRYGTSVRTFDPRTRTWQISWFNPVSGAFDVLHANVDGYRIVQVGRSASGVEIMWTFEEINSSDFLWVGQSRVGEGAWSINAEFSGRRIA